MHPEWPLILFTFFLCVAGGALGAQGLLNVMGKGKKMQLASLVTALAALVVGGLSVFMHLQHWERIFNGFGHITSGITLEFIGCIVFAVVLVLYFLMMRRAEDGMAPKWCGVLAIVVGLALPVVTGMSYLMASLPSWNTPLLPVYYLANTVFMGGLTALVIAGLTRDDSARDLSVKMALVGGAQQQVAVYAYAIVINCSALTFWLGVVAVGLVVPLVLTWLAKKVEAGTKLAAYAGAALACVVVGGLCWRVILYVVAISIFALY